MQARRSILRIRLLLLAFVALAQPVCHAAAAVHDTIIRQGLVLDGSGSAPYVGDVAIDGDQIAYVGRHAPGRGRSEIDARGKAVAPGFINMLSHSEDSLLADGRALSDLTQGITLEVMGESSMGPLSATMKTLMKQRQTDVSFDVDWTTLGEYLEKLEKHGISPNVASFVGAGTIRSNFLGEADIDPTPAQLRSMQHLVRQAMEEGAMGLTTALLYTPDQFAKTPELIALARESARCGGMYIAHMRFEGNRVLEGVKETIDISRASGGPAEIYHMKLAGKNNWNKLDALVSLVSKARAGGIRISADMYMYTAGQTGLDAAMPPWVQDGGLEQWIARLKDPGMRARVVTDMRDPNPTWDNLYLGAGPAGTLLLGFKSPALRPLIGKTIADVAAARGISGEDAVIDLVVEDGSEVRVAYFLMSEANIRREIALPWVSIASDSEAQAPEGAFLESSVHPRAYGNVARLLGKYVREEKVISLQEAIRRLTSLPAANLSLRNRGRLRAGHFADVVVFDPALIQDHATFEKPQQLSTGVDDVWVNGIRALKGGVATGAPSGRFIRGRAWTGFPGGGCRASSKYWHWEGQ
jgi:N-acyl-D-amino-acid deacylase